MMPTVQASAGVPRYDTVPLRYGRNLSFWRGKMRRRRRGRVSQRKGE